MDAKTSVDKIKSPCSRPDKSLDQSSKSKCSTSEDCSKTGSEYFIHFDCTSGTPTTKSSISRNDTMDWAELKNTLDKTKHMDDKHKVPFRRFSDKCNLKSHNIHTEHECMSEDEMKKTISTQRSEAESYAHTELFERKMHEMRELYDLRIKQMHDKLDRANQSTQLLKAQMSKMSKDYTVSMFEVQKDNTALRRLIKSLSKRSTLPESESIQRITQLENYLVMWQRRCQADAVKLKELQMTQNQHNDEIRNIESSHSEKIMTLMKDYQHKLEEMEKSYLDQMSNLETEHQDILAERENEIVRLRDQIHQQCIKMEHELNALRDRKTDSESCLKEMEMELKCSEKKKEATFRFLEGPFMKDFTNLITENHGLKMLLLKHSSESWGCIFNESMNVSKEAEQLKDESEKIARMMEMRISTLRDGRHDMGDYQDSYEWKGMPN